MVKHTVTGANYCLDIYLIMLIVRRLLIVYNEAAVMVDYKHKISVYLFKQNVSYLVILYRLSS